MPCEVLESPLRTSPLGPEPLRVATGLRKSMGCPPRLAAEGEWPRRSVRLPPQSSPRARHSRSGFCLLDRPPVEDPVSGPRSSTRHIRGPPDSPPARNWAELLVASRDSWWSVHEIRPTATPTHR